MQLCKLCLETGAVRPGIVDGAQVYYSGTEPAGGLSALLHAPNPRAAAAAYHAGCTASIPLARAHLLAPVEEQEIWAAGVTYTRSREARERESEGAARFYDLVYKAARPELFFKATAARAVGPGDAVRIRQDSRWNVPEPELTLVVAPDLRLVGFTIGNDMSSRDIEGENPLYLPQAKVYQQSCALGPVITLVEDLPPPDQVTIRLTIHRGGQAVFDGSTTLAAMARTFADLLHWLGRDNSFPRGVLLLTGTGIVPPDDFTLAAGDSVTIGITGIGELTNPVVCG